MAIPVSSTSVAGCPLSLPFLRVGLSVEGWGSHDKGFLDLGNWITPQRSGHLQFALVETGLQRELSI